MRTIAALGALASAFAACGGGPQAPAASQPASSAPPAASEPATSTPPPATTPATNPRAEELPQAVTTTVEAIRDAARARDYAALARLVDRETFSYSFGESGDPVGYWRRMEEEGEVPILGDILPTVLSMPVAKRDGIFVWPSAYASDPSEWTAAELEPLRQLYTATELEQFRQAGGYLGWRVGIREDGTWLFFVAGD